MKDCSTCQVYSKQPPVAPLHPWAWPGRTWHRIHIDYAGPFEGRMLLIIVDAHSKYIDAHVVSAATISVTLTKLRQTFATLGLPSTLVSDNGSCFTSEEFEQFCRANGIKHIKSSPYHPSGNGLAGLGAAQTVKARLNKTFGNLEDRLYTFLSHYRVIPHAATGRAPAEFVLKTPPSTRLDLLRSSIQNSIAQTGRRHRTTRAVERSFMAGDVEFARTTEVGRYGNREPDGSADLRGTTAGRQNVEAAPGSLARDGRLSRLKSVRFHRGLTKSVNYH